MIKKIVSLIIAILTIIVVIYAFNTKNDQTAYAGIAKGHIAILDPDTGTIQDSFPELNVNRILDYFDKDCLLVAISKEKPEYSYVDVCDIYKLNLKSLEKELILSDVSEAYLSPVKNCIAYIQNGTLNLFYLESKTSEKIAENIIFYSGFPKPWSPDGNKLAYSVELPGILVSQIYVYDLPSKNCEAIRPDDQEAHPYVLNWDKENNIVAVHNPLNDNDTVKIIKIKMDGTKETMVDIPVEGAPTIEDIRDNLLLIRYSETNSLALLNLDKKEEGAKKVLTVNDPDFRVFANILPNGNIFYKEVRFEELDGSLKEHRVKTGLWRQNDEQTVTLPDDLQSIGG